MISLTDRYRPATLADIKGQGAAVRQLRSLLAEPVSCALLLSGPTGCGKTSAALAFARELGVDVANEEFGGLYQIASGEQTGDSVRELVRSLRHWPMTGNGWRVAIVNEADHTTASAAHVWLDVLESLPERCCVVFTTNAVDKLLARFRDRCERVEFVAGVRQIKRDAEAFAAEVWKREGGNGSVPTLEALGAVENGLISFRRMLQGLAQLLRAKPMTCEQAIAAARAAGKTVMV